ncbi:MAG: MFS transporter [Marmoricola sp.]
MTGIEGNSPASGSGVGRSVADRLEAMPFGRFHRNFLLMVTAGEFVETLMLLGNGVLLALVAEVLHFSPNVSIWLIPVAFFFGEFFGSIISGQIADRLGRKVVFNYDLLVFGIGMIVAGFVSTDYLIGIFVFIAGLGVGGEFPVVDAYTAEMFPGKDRGRRMAMVYTIAVLAAPLIAGLAYAVSHPTAGYYSWRALFWFIGFCGLVVWVVRFRVPESPRWLESQGRNDEAHALLSRIEASDGLPDSAPPSAPGADSTSAPAAVGATRSRLADAFAPDVRSRTIMMLVFQFFQSGVFYGFTALAPVFLEKKGIDLVHTLQFSMVIYAGFFVGSIFSIFTIDKIERKWGIVLTAVIAGILGTAFATVNNEAATVVLGFFVTFTLWQFSNFLHTYQAEVFPTRLRTTAAGLTYSISRISTSLWVYLIGTFLVPNGLLASYALIWVFIVVVVVDIGVFGPKTSRRRVEHIVT